MKSVGLFARVGGLALDVSSAGFTSGVVVEWNKWACDTIKENQQRQNPPVAD